MLIEISLVIVIACLVYYILKQRKNSLELKKECKKVKSDYRSLYVKHGKHWEQFVPFMKDFAEVASKENFCFLGMPIDGICFDEDAVKFIEIKTGKAGLSQKQRKIRDLVKNGAVKWIELRY